MKKVHDIKKHKGQNRTICNSCGKLWEEHTCYWAPCDGCKDGHSSFHKTVVESPEWQAWEKEVSNRMSVGNYKKAFDVAESVELGFLSPLHFESFLDWCCEERYKKELAVADDRFKVCERQLTEDFEDGERTMGNR